MMYGFPLPLISDDQKNFEHLTSIPDWKGLRLADALHVYKATNFHLDLSILNILQKERFQEP